MEAAGEDAAVKEGWAACRAVLLLLLLMALSHAGHRCSASTLAPSVFELVQANATCPYTPVLY